MTDSVTMVNRQCLYVGFRLGEADVNDVCRLCMFGVSNFGGLWNMPKGKSPTKVFKKIHYGKSERSLDGRFSWKSLRSLHRRVWWNMSIKAPWNDFVESLHGRFS